MKKLYVLVMVVVLCTVAWAGTTYVIGGQVESRFYSLIDEHSRFGPITLTSQDYQRGILSSKAETVLKIVVPKQGSQVRQDATAESIELVFEHQLEHGPLAFGSGPGNHSFAPALTRIQTRLVDLTIDGDTPEDFPSEISELKEPFAFTRVDFTGTTHTQVLIPAFEKQEDDVKLSWGGVTLETEYSPAKKTLVGTFAMPGMNINMEDGQINWNGISGQFDLIEALPLLYVGTNSMKFGTLDMNLPDPTTGDRINVQMKEFKASSASHYNGKLVDYKQTLEFAGITLDGETFGPGTLEIEAKSLEGQTLSDFQGQAQDIYRGLDRFDQEELVTQILPLYSQFLMKLVEGNPEVNVSRLHFATPMGEVDGRVQVKFSAEQDSALSGPAALLQNLDASVDLTIHESLVNAIMSNIINKKLTEARDRGTIPSYSDEEIASLVEMQYKSQLEGILQQNFITREGDKLKASATFNQGELVLNGQVLPVF